MPHLGSMLSTTKVRNFLFFYVVLLPNFQWFFWRNLIYIAQLRIFCKFLKSSTQLILECLLCQAIQWLLKIYHYNKALYSRGRLAQLGKRLPSNPAIRVRFSTKVRRDFFSTRGNITRNLDFSKYFFRRKYRSRHLLDNSRLNTISIE